jgi:hypothetical protein
MRRRHGIPDTDTRPFDIAYRDVAKAKAFEEAERVRLEEARQEAASRNNIAQNLSQEKENIWPGTLESTPRPPKRTS